jgi:restriction system protein
VTTLGSGAFTAVRAEARFGPIFKANFFSVAAQNERDPPSDAGMITSETPRDWRALQQEVASILQQCGFEVDVEKKVRTVRGEVEIDVYAEETVTGRKYVILCECKHWASRVPQSVVHSFRTTVADIGANVGYVVSTNGFQAGAYAASELTNVRLTNWQEFQAAFRESWLEEHFLKTLTKRLDSLIEYPSPHSFWQLKARVDALASLVMDMSSHAWIFNKKSLPALPLKDTFRDRPGFLSHIPPDITEQVGYKQLLERLVFHGEAALTEIEVIRNRGA